MAEDWTGTEGPDKHTGTNGNDRLDGLGGNDVLWGAGGKDALLGGHGDDTLYGNAGDDTLYGRWGDDILYGGAGADVFFISGGGKDTIADFEKDDRVDVSLYFTSYADMQKSAGYVWNREKDIYQKVIASGDQVEDRIVIPLVKFKSPTAQNFIFGTDVDRPKHGPMLEGSNQLDWIGGSAMNDRMFGRGGNDRMNGEDGDDYAEGDDGNDSIYGDDGNDTLKGEAGNDFIYGGLGDDTLRGGAGDDVVDGGPQCRPLGLGRVVLVQPRDLVEQRAALGVVEPLRRQGLRRGRQPGKGVGTQRPLQIGRLEMLDDGERHASAASRTPVNGHRAEAGKKLR